MNCKAHNGSLVLVDVDRAEAAPGSLTIAKSGEMYSPASWSFKISSSGTDYKQARVAYTDPKTGDTHMAEVASGKATDVTEGEKTLALQKRVEDTSQAIALGKGELHKANAREQTASLECLGCPRLAAGQMLEMTGFGDFSGRYFIKTATHRVSGSGGYTTSLELTTPAPTRAVSAHDEVSVAAEASRAGAQAAREERRSFERLYELVRREGTELDRLLVCLPEIAAAMAERTKTFADRQGWLYLHEMFLKWFSGRANPDALLNPDVLWVDMDWALSYTRVNMAYQRLSARTYLFSPQARAQLADILRRDGKLLPDAGCEFDYTIAEHTHWRADYFQQVNVQGMLVYPPDGLMAAMGDFQLRALAKGFTLPEDDHHLIFVTGVSVFIWDSFNFHGEAPLGFWRCSPPEFSSEPFDASQELNNSTFRGFRSGFGHGEDFLVLSHPQKLDPFVAFVYETDS